MSIQSTFFDPVVGLDIHIVGIPAPPSPVLIPTPIPMPFIGLVFDPLGLLIGAAISMALGAGPGVVLVNGLPATNCGTAVTNMLTMPHISAPGVVFMKTFTPIRIGDAELFFGSLNVSLAGTYGVRFGDVALSCSDPVRLPLSVVIAIPKGPLVLNMPPMVADLKAIAIAAIMRVVMKILGAAVRAGARLFRSFRQGSAFFNRVSRALGGCEPPANASRWSQMWHRTVRFVTGHPVDVVTGNVFTEAIDLRLPGPLPLEIERVYESAGSGKSSTLGYGWNHTLDESVWLEPGRAVVRLGDGREIEFGLWDLPGRCLRPGDVLDRKIHKLKLVCVAEGQYEIHHANDRVHEFSTLDRQPGGIARLVKIRSLDRHHSIDLSYDDSGNLEWVVDSCQRRVHFQHDHVGRLVAISTPSPDSVGFQRRRIYEYDEHGDLICVADSHGASWRYEYSGHLLTRETDRTGLSFYFQYDGIGSLSRCIQTWGDGGIINHTIDYDRSNRKTFVTNSLAETTTYDYNIRNQVTAITDPIGSVRRYEYDADTGGISKFTDPLGGQTSRKYNSSGDVIEIVGPDGLATRFEYDQDHHAVCAIDPGGSERTWKYHQGRLVSKTTPAGESFWYSWNRGLLTWIEDNRGQRINIQYDEHNNPVRVQDDLGRTLTYEYDNACRARTVTNGKDGVTHIKYDAEDRVVMSQSPSGQVQNMRHDAEGNVLEIWSSTRRVKFGYGHHHRVMWREEDGARIKYEYDLEGRIKGVTSEADESHQFHLDPAGNVIAETAFDGQTRRYVRDAAGQIVKVIYPSGRTSESKYDLVGRLTEVRYSDGTFNRFSYDHRGLLREAENEVGLLEFQRGADGRVIKEKFRDFEIFSTYDSTGRRSAIETSLGAHMAIGRDRSGDVSELFFGERKHHDYPSMAIQRDELGLEVQRRFDNGIGMSWARDESGRPVKRWTTHAVGEQVHLVNQFDLEWRDDEQISARIDHRGLTRRYEHDARGRLVRESRSDGGVIVKNMDPVGNPYRSMDGRDRRYAEGGRLAARLNDTYEYDEDGNLVLRSGAQGEWCYQWNGRGDLIAVERPDGVVLEFEYDALSRRVTKRKRNPKTCTTDERQFVWDQNVVVHEFEERGDLTTWYWEPETFTPIARERGAQRLIIVADHLGTPTDMYDEAGNSVWSMDLDIYGNPTFERGGAHDCPWRWPGQYDDTDLQLYYNRYRYYGVAEGRYLSRDPIGIMGGLNAYGYVVDVMTWIDPFGLAATFCGVSNRWRDIETGRYITRPMDPADLVHNGAVDYNTFMRWINTTPGGAPSSSWSPSPNPNKFTTGGFKFEISDGATTITTWGHGPNIHAPATSFSRSNPTIRFVKDGSPFPYLHQSGSWGLYNTAADKAAAHIPLTGSPF